MTGTDRTGVAGSLAVLARVSDLLRELTDAEITELVEGRARLAVVPRQVPAGPSAPAGTGTMAAAAATATAAATAAVGRPGAARRADPAPATELDDAWAALAALSSRDEGARYLSSWTVSRLRALAARLEMRGVTALRRADLIERIVGQTISFRLNSTAIRQR